MNNFTPANWLRGTGKLRIILLITALVGKAVLYLFCPPYFISKAPLIIPFSFLVALDVAWAIITSIIILECIRVIAFRATSSWANKKHFALVCTIIALLVVYKVVILSSKTSTRYYNYGWSLAEKKEYQEAIRSLDISIGYNPKNINAYLERGYLQRELGNLDAALNNFNKAIDIDPDHANAYAGRGFTYYYLGDHEKALNDWNKAITLDPNMSSRLDKWINKVKTQP